MDKLRFFKAAASGDIEGMKNFLDNGFNINEVEGGSKLNALMFAVVSQKKESVDFLLKNNINIKAFDANQWTALFFATAVGDFQITRKLLKSGADPKMKVEDGRTSLKRVFEDRKPELLLLFKKHENLLGREDKEQIRDIKFKVHFEGKYV